MKTVIPRLHLLAALAAALHAYPLSYASNPLHAAPPAEAVNPLYEGREDAASLAPLQAWVRQRCADGTCTVEQLQRELQTALDEMHERARKGHQILLDDIKLAKDARESLLKEIAAARSAGLPLRPLADKAAGLPPIPAERAWGDPHVDRAPAATTTRASSGKRATTSSSATITTSSGAGRTVTDSSSAGSTATVGDPDMDAIVTKLKEDLATLATLTHKTQQDLQAATARMQKASAALARQSKAFHEAAMNSIRNLKG
jgi:hypothetical protein